MKKLDLSFVIPVRNEEKSIETLYKEILTNTLRTKKSFEIIFIDDGSTDNSFKNILELNKKDKRVKVIKFRGGWAKSAALQVGFENTSGDIVFTLDGDLQDNPKEINRFLKEIKDGADMVVGWKKTRHDPWHKVIPSRILNNFLIPLLTGVKIHDTNCGYKAMKREVLSCLNLYGEQYRYIPILASKANYKVVEIVIDHRQRKFGKSKFGIERNIKGLLDLMTVVLLTGFARRPGHFFGGLGIISFAVGFTIGLYIGFLRITTGSIQYRHPLLFLGILLMIIGVQLVSTGLLAEMIIYSKQKVDYNAAVEKTYGFKKTS